MSMRLSENEYIAKFGVYRATSQDEVERARDILRKAAHNKIYIPPTNPDAIFLELSRHYHSKMIDAQNRLASISKELSALKRSKVD